MLSSIYVLAEFKKMWKKNLLLPDRLEESMQLDL